MLLVVDTHACDQSNYAVIIPDEPIENSTLKDGIHIPSDKVAGLESLYLMRKNISVDWFGKGATEVVSTEIIGMEKRILNYAKIRNLHRMPSLHRSIGSIDQLSSAEMPGRRTKKAKDRITMQTCVTHSPS
ncbi:unnamed protein product [Onchocerca ochengi]|uniref:Transposase n=1 Tax=Onchocerca ochengi TaxID=42157 RepID=A0A182E3X6_ONCOC|nr:unnamed protein product [Onchocerca ochengi]